MSEFDDDAPAHRGDLPQSGKALTTSRVGRLGKVARLASGVAGGMLAEGTRQLVAGKLPRAKDMLLTPGNARRVARQLADMRGAAMKFGQLLSMDTGDLLPKELAEILSRLRSQARYMPERQLQQVMQKAYGKRWRDTFEHFDPTPIAAASIGQVHCARTHQQQEIVLKVQYPGVADSIESDIDNIATLLRMSGLVPSGINLQPLLDDAKVQLKQETNYQKEARHLQSFAEALEQDSRYCVPTLYPELCKSNVLAMAYADGIPIEDLVSQPQAVRDQVMTALFALLLRELFELRMMQTDPNFANYRYQIETAKIVLLDFGATRKFKANFSRQYLKIIQASLKNDESGMCAAAAKLGYAVGVEKSAYQTLVINVFNTLLEPLQRDAVFDFANSGLPARLAKLGEHAREFQDFWQAPPADAVYLHRKVGGMFLLATRLEARVNLRALMKKWLE